MLKYTQRVAQLFRSPLLSLEIHCHFMELLGAAKSFIIAVSAKECVTLFDAQTLIMQKYMMSAQSSSCGPQGKEALPSLPCRTSDTSSTLSVPSVWVPPAESSNSHENLHREDAHWKQGSPEEGSMDWYHWIAARFSQECDSKHPAWRIGGIAHAQWSTLQAYIVSFVIMTKPCQTVKYGV